MDMQQFAASYTGEKSKGNSFKEACVFEESSPRLLLNLRFSRRVPDV